MSESEREERIRLRVENEEIKAEEEIRVVFEHHKRRVSFLHGRSGKGGRYLIDRDFCTTAPLKKWTTDVSRVSRLKQNGCSLLSTGKHPFTIWQPLSFSAFLR